MKYILWHSIFVVTMTTLGCRGDFLDSPGDFLGNHCDYLGSHSDYIWCCYKSMISFNKAL